MSAVWFVLAAYLLGAVPFGVLLGLARGVDVRARGSDNIGATNVGRVLGRRWGYLCLVLDILKGLLPTLAASRVLLRRPVEAGDLLACLAVALAAVLGHVYSIFLRLRGGKGVATTIGVALGIYPYLTLPMLAALVCYAAARLATGIVSVGSLTIAVVFPLAFAVYVGLRGDMGLEQFWPLQAAAALLGLLIVVRHRSNIARLLRGQERRISEPAALEKTARR